MKAIIMAGGSGQRLRPLTCKIPKPMAPLMGKPVMRYAVELLRRHGVEQIGATLSYRAKEIQNEFGGELRYFVEDSPRGTAGSVGLAREWLDETFVILSGDALTDIDLSAALEFHRAKSALATLVLKRVEKPLEYGVVMTEPDGKIQRFLEKPGWGQVFSDTVNTGIYILEPEALDLIPQTGSYDFGKQLFPQMVEEGLPIYGFVAEGYWCDIGDAATYLQAHFDALDGKVKGMRGATAPGARIEEGAQIEQPCWIGPDAVVRAGAKVGPYAVIGPGAHVLSGASVSRSVLWEKALVASGAEARGALLLDGAQLCQGAQAYEGAVLGSEAVAREGCVLSSGALVWPEKVLPAYARISGCLKEGASREVSLGSRGLSGESMELLSPETLASAGRAYAETLQLSTCALAHDGSGAAAMAADALRAGLSSAGARVYLLGAATPQTLWYAQRELELGGAVHTALTGALLHADLYDAQGCELEGDVRRNLRQALQRIAPPHLGAEEVPLPVRVTGATAQRVSALRDMLGIGHFAGSASVHAGDAQIRREASHLIKDTEGLRAQIPADGEMLLLTDERGREVPQGSYPLLAAHLVHALEPDAPILATLQDSMRLDELAEEWGVDIIRCRPGRRALMAATQRHPLWRILYFDAVGALCVLLCHLRAHNLSLSQLVDALPASERRAVRIPCLDGEKGRILRGVIESSRGMPVDLRQGVRVGHDRGWALVLPMEDEPACQVVSEAMNAEFADELSAFYVDLVEKARNNPDA